MQSIPHLRCLTCAAAAFLVFSCPDPALLGQVQQDPGTLPNGRRIQFPGNRPETPASPAASTPGQTGTPAPAPAAADPSPSLPPSLPPSLLDKPAQPAKVKLFNGQLSVTAMNSSLSGILDAIETTSGMKIDGLGKDQRIFGVYGPGDPRDVLSSLLDGAGYNFLMVGNTSAGTPSEMILTQRSNAATVPQQASSQPQPEEDNQPVVNNNPPDDVPFHPSNVLAPPNADGGVRTPQEILQQLERMRSQQSEQQPQ